MTACSAASNKNLASVGFGLCVLFALASDVWATFPSENWAQVNQNGFVAGQGDTQAGSKLFVFDSRLYAFNEFGLFRMDDPTTRTWSQVMLPAQPGGPGMMPKGIKPFGGYLYAWDANKLWWIAAGADLGGPGWTGVTSTGLPAGDSPVPMVMFNGSIYGVYHPGGSGPFEIWRSADVGAAAAAWVRTVENAFDDPANNTGVDVMIVFNGRIYAGTTTLALGANFGAPTGYGTGVEIWESASGNSGSWSQVNSDGFGTMFPTPPCFLPALCTFAIHQVIGSAAVYRPTGAAQEYLYIGTKSHFGAEVWRYDGTGIGGWVNVTPPWAGPCLAVLCVEVVGPGRNEAMAVYRNTLYLGEGFPTGNLAMYDGTNWSVEAPGPNPFGSGNGGVVSLVVFDGNLYAGTLHSAGGTQGDQVWRYTSFLPAKEVPAGSLVGLVFLVLTLLTWGVWLLGRHSPAIRQDNETRRLS